MYTYYKCIYIFIYRIIHTCIYTYIHTYINTYLHTYIYYVDLRQAFNKVIQNYDSTKLKKVSS